MGRAPCCDKANVKRGPWSPQEDATLINYLHIHGIAGSWISLPQKAGLKRCGKSCRLRWLNYLRPDIKHGGFTEEEDNIICNLYSQMGSRWSLIASQLPGRTDNDVKNHWNTKLKKKLLQLQLQLQANSSSSCFNITNTATVNNGFNPTTAETLLPKAEPYNLDYSTNISHPILSDVVGYGFPVSRTDQNLGLVDPDPVMHFATPEAVTHDLSQLGHININVTTTSQDESSSISDSTSLQANGNGYDHHAELNHILMDDDQFRFSYMFPYSNEFVDGLWSSRDKVAAAETETETETVPNLL